MKHLTNIIAVLFFGGLILNPFPISAKARQKEIIVDSTASLKIGNYIVIPKQFFPCELSENSNDDTLKIFSCSDFVYSPFGDIKNKTKLKTSLLNNFEVKNKTVTESNGEFEFQILTLKSSKIILYFNKNPDGSKDSYIFKGEINDSIVNFTLGIRIGMSSEEFFKVFFDKFPKELMTKYHVIEFSSCVDAITHIYNFYNYKLKSIDYVSDSYWTVDY